MLLQHSNLCNLEVTYYYVYEGTRRRLDEPSRRLGLRRDASPIRRCAPFRNAKYRTLHSHSSHSRATVGKNAPLFMAVSLGGVPIFLSEHHGDGIPGPHVRIEMNGIEEFYAVLSIRS